VIDYLRKNPSQVAAGALVVVAILVWWFWPPAPTRYADKTQFFTDAALTFQWHVHGHEFNFSRKDHMSPWTPLADPPDIQNRLNLLGTTTPVKMDRPEPQQINIVVGFGPGNEWSGIYGKGIFAWTDGIKKGYGFRLDEPHARLFEEGSLAFTKHVWQWCEARPTAIAVHLNGQDFRIYQKDHGWRRKDVKGDVAIDPTHMEKWLGSSCELPVEYFRDLETFPIDGHKSDDFVAVEYDKKTVKFPLQNNFFIVREGLAVTGDKIFEAFATPGSFSRLR
jgi:hypothetical protein